MTQNNTSTCKEEKLFISWSGETGKKAANLIYNWIGRIFNNTKQNVFLSPRIEPGLQGTVEITDALEKCSRGFFIMTRERLSSPWIHFEAGAIFKANHANRVIPIYVDVKRESLKSDPLSEFQSNISFNYKDLENLILRTGNDLNWNFCEGYYNDSEEISNVFIMNIDNLLHEITPDSVMLKLHQDCQDYNYCYTCATSGCLAHLDENSFFSIRKTAVEYAHGELIITGPSLTEALGRGRTNNRSLRGTLINGIKEKRITDIKLLLTDLSMFEFVCTESNEAISRVMGSLNFLKNELFHICDELRCNISVYFLPLHNVPHVVLTDKYMLYRATKLWTSNGEYKGEFTLYKNSGTQSEYAIQYAYLKKLMELCTTINLDIDTVDNKSDSYITKEIKNWRRSIKQTGGHALCEEHLGELKHIHLYKLYNSQLTHYIACDWNGPDHSELHFKPSNQICNTNDLFNSDNLLGDSTQKYLVKYIRKTEELLRGVVEKYSTANVNGEKLSDAHIYPSLDLGFPNNAVRLAGGFATGMLVTWKSLGLIEVDYKSEFVFLKSEMRLRYNSQIIELSVKDKKDKLRIGNVMFTYDGFLLYLMSEKLYNDNIVAFTRGIWERRGYEVNVIKR